MKKFMLFSVLCSLVILALTGCAEVSPSQSDGYQQVEGNLEVLDTKTVSMKTVDGQALSFKLAPETLVYHNEGKEFNPGDEITVVFEGKLNGTDTKDVSVIAVSQTE